MKDGMRRDGELVFSRLKQYVDGTFSSDAWTRTDSAPFTPAAAFSVRAELDKLIIDAWARSGAANFGILYLLMTRTNGNNARIYDKNGF
jgi:hypothetical protein